MLKSPEHEFYNESSEHTVPCREIETLASTSDGWSLPLKPQAYKAKPKPTAYPNLPGQNDTESEANRPCTTARCLET